MTSLPPVVCHGTLACRACGGTSFSSVLDLGRTPLANSYLRAEDLARPEPRFPLEVVRCRGCTLVQLTETVPPQTLFSEYLYFSSFSSTMLAHARALAASLVRERRLGAASLVVEVASNDGYLLRGYVDAGVPVLGIEPARNIAEVARERGIRTECAFFDRALGEALAARGERADVLHAHNVLAHVPDLRGFVAGIAAVLKDEGIAILEVPYLKDLLDGLSFDTIYHEHLCYFSATALHRLFREQGLSLVDVVRDPIHGGSLRLSASPAATAPAPHPRVAALLEEEARWGVDDEAPYTAFAARVAALRQELPALLRSLRAQGKSIAAYGAAAKATTLGHACGLGADLVDFVVDRSPHKQGRFLPGSHVPIRAPEALMEARPDYVLLFTWNFAAEIAAQQADYRAQGGRFIVPVPTPHIL